MLQRDEDLFVYALNFTSKHEQPEPTQSGMITWADGTNRQSTHKLIFQRTKKGNQKIKMHRFDETQYENANICYFVCPFDSGYYWRFHSSSLFPIYITEIR